MELTDYISPLGIMAAMIAAFSHILYINSILKGETKPSRVTWFIWSILGSILAISYYLSGATFTLWVPVGEAIWYIIIAFLSIKYGQGGWTLIDRMALIGAAICGVLWYLTGSATVALVSAIGVDFMAAIPTAYKSFVEPKTENKKAWIFTCISSLLNLIALNSISFSILIYPIYMFVMNSLITSFLFRENRSN